MFVYEISKYYSWPFCEDVRSAKYVHNFEVKIVKVRQTFKKAKCVQYACVHCEK